MNIVSYSSELWTFSYLNFHEEVTIEIPFTGKLYSHTFVYSSWNFNLLLHFYLLKSFSFTITTNLLYLSTFTSTSLACTLHHKHSLFKSLCSFTWTSSTFFWFSTWFTFLSITSGTNRSPLILNDLNKYYFTFLVPLTLSSKERTIFIVMGELSYCCCWPLLDFCENPPPKRSLKIS